jgi:hypothetical protein
MKQYIKPNIGVSTFKEDDYLMLTTSNTMSSSSQLGKENAVEAEPTWEPIETMSIWDDE